MSLKDDLIQLNTNHILVYIYISPPHTNTTKKCSLHIFNKPCSLGSGQNTGSRHGLIIGRQQLTIIEGLITNLDHMVCHSHVSIGTSRPSAPLGFSSSSGSTSVFRSSCTVFNGSSASAWIFIPLAPSRSPTPLVLSWPPSLSPQGSSNEFNSS